MKKNFPPVSKVRKAALFGFVSGFVAAQNMDGDFLYTVSKERVLALAKAWRRRQDKAASGTKAS